ncbi:MAG: phosphoribosylamine--glycine ligase [Deltaproteobacteria bacterium]|nr:phosphoribosylamine--glycine ligase [Deltaproteobacteria bacterium]
MRIVLVGGGGREHALARAMARHGHALYFTHDNPGFAGLGERAADDPLIAARQVAAELVVIGPEAPLAAGLVDRLEAERFTAFGPSAAAARLESSKIFTKSLAARHGLPTAAARVLRRGDGFVIDRPWVVKLDGLAAGKGVWVPDSVEGTRVALDEAFAARPDAAVLLEERLEGPELSVLGIADGTRVVPLIPARDHKRRHDGDHGPNTGGMGAVAPVTVPDDTLAECHHVLRRAVLGMKADGVPFRGVLYGGFMLTSTGPKLLEFNVRFGDPECQPLMALLAEDPVPWFCGAARGELPGQELRFSALHACCVVVAGHEYPERGASAPITRLPADADDLVVYHAGTSIRDGALWATGGRVLGVTGLGPTPASARVRAYAGVDEVRFAGSAWRCDIGV